MAVIVCRLSACVDASSWTAHSMRAVCTLLLLLRADRSACRRRHPCCCAAECDCFVHWGFRTPLEAIWAICEWFTPVTGSILPARFCKLYPANLKSLKKHKIYFKINIKSLPKTRNLFKNHKSPKKSKLKSRKGGPEPLENEINKILRSKLEDRFSDHFPDLVQNICSVRFSYLLRLSIFCKAPLDMRKFQQKCQKIAGCWESPVYGSRPPITSKPGSSPPERPGLDNITSQPWSEATCPCTTSASAYLRFVTNFLLELGKDKTKY